MVQWNNRLLTNLSFQGPGLRERFARGVFSLGIGTIVAKACGLGSKMVLTRLLASDEMGLIVILLSFTQLLEVITEVGIKQSLIQHKQGATREYMNMAWWFQMVRGSLIYVVAFAFAPLVCRLYFSSNTEILEKYTLQEISLMLRILFLTVLLNCLVSPGAHVLEKNFHFFKAMILLQGSFILGTLVTILLTILHRSAWSLVIGFTSNSAFKLFLSVLICPSRPQFRFHAESFRALLNFARGLFGIPILTYIAYNIDILISGKILSAQILGIWGMAKILAMTPFDLFSKIIFPVLLPAFSEKQDQPEALKKAILQITKLVALIGFPLVILVFMNAKTILELAFGLEYGQISAAFGVFSLSVLLIIFASILTTFLLALGIPSKFRTFVVVRVLLLVGMTYPAIRLAGVMGLASSFLLANVVSLFFVLRTVQQMTNMRTGEYWKAMIPSFYASVILFVFAYGFAAVYPGHPHLLLLICIFGFFLVEVGILCLSAVINKGSFSLLKKEAQDKNG